MELRGDWSAGLATTSGAGLHTAHDRGDRVEVMVGQWPGMVYGGRSGHALLHNIVRLLRIKLGRCHHVWYRYLAVIASQFIGVGLMLIHICILFTVS